MWQLVSIDRTPDNLAQKDTRRLSISGQTSCWTNSLLAINVAWKSASSSFLSVFDVFDVSLSSQTPSLLVRTDHNVLSCCLVSSWLCKISQRLSYWKIRNTIFATALRSTMLFLKEFDDVVDSAITVFAGFLYTFQKIFSFGHHFCQSKRDSISRRKPLCFSSSFLRFYDYWLWEWEKKRISPSISHVLLPILSCLSSYCCRTHTETFCSFSVKCFILLPLHDFIASDSSSAYVSLQPFLHQIFSVLCNFTLSPLSFKLMSVLFSSFCFLRPHMSVFPETTANVSLVSKRWKWWYHSGSVIPKRAMKGVNIHFQSQEHKQFKSHCTTQSESTLFFWLNQSQSNRYINI